MALEYVASVCAYAKNSMSKKTDVDPLSYSQVADSSNRWRGLRWLRVDAAALYFLWFHNPLMLTDEYFHRQHNTLFHARWATTSCFFLTNCTEISEEHQETPNFLFLVISIHLENLCLLSLTLHQFSTLCDFLLLLTCEIYDWRLFKLIAYFNTYKIFPNELHL